MEKFNEFNYCRPNYNEVDNNIKLLINRLKVVDDCDEYINIVRDIIKIQNHIEEMHDYADIKNMRNSKDEFFSLEMYFWNEYKPKFDLLFIPFYEQCLNSKFIELLKQQMPENFFNTIEFQLKTNSKQIVELQKLENQLKNTYKEITSEKIIFLGEERTIPYISGYFSHGDRNLRKLAHDTINDFYYSKQQQLDNLFYELINVRNKMAKNLGFENYCMYSVYKLRRFGYDYRDISKFRDNIIKYILPICKKLNEWKKEELGLEKIEYYDTIYFKNMPEPLYSGKELLIHLEDTLKQISERLYSFYKDMLENGYIDLEIRDNKINYAITNYLSESAYPVITGSFRNSYLDVSTVTHEFGHSYQKYNAGIKDKNYIISALLKYPTFDIAEMFSHAMELICMNHVQNLFNNEDYNKYCFMKTYDIVNKLPYICLVDEFQQKVYSTDNLKRESIRKIWLDLSKKYNLDNDNQGHINLIEGGYFYRQSHVFLNPFYFIDYALSYFGAFAIANGCSSDLKVFEDAAEVASYYPLKTLISSYDIQSPFKEQSIKEISETLKVKLLKYKI